MKRRSLLVTTGAVTAAGLAGCLGSDDNPAADDAGDDSNDDDDSSKRYEDPRTITVGGTGEVEAEPDLAVLRVSVEVTGDDVEAVRDELSARADAVRDALLEYGLDEDAVTTRQFDIREQIDHRRLEREGVDPESREEVEEYTYYEGTHSYSVEVEDVEAVGDVIDTAVDAGADDIGRVQFTLSEDRREELREEALAEAIENARSEAEIVADEVGASIVEVKTIDTTGSQVSPVYERVAYDAEDDAAGSTELHPDDVSVSADVQAEYVME